MTRGVPEELGAALIGQSIQQFVGAHRTASRQIERKPTTSTPSITINTATAIATAVVTAIAIATATATATATAIARGAPLFCACLVRTSPAQVRLAA